PFWGSAERRQFPTSASQGIYNAALALLDYESDGSPMYNESRPLLEYALPRSRCANGCAPPVWLSAISGGTIWPIKAVDSSENDYVFHPKFIDKSIPAGRQTTFPSNGWLIVFIMLSVGIALHAAILFDLATWPLRADTCSRWVEQCRRRDPAQCRCYGFVC